MCISCYSSDTRSVSLFQSRSKYIASELFLVIKISLTFFEEIVRIMSRRSHVKSRYLISFKPCEQESISVAQVTIIFQYFKLYVKVLRRPFTSYPRSLLSSFHPPDSSSFLSISLFPFHAFIWIGMRRIVQDRPRAREIMRFGCLPLLLLLERLFVLPSSLS